MNSSGSPTFSQSSQFSDSDRSLDALFRSYSIQEVSRTLSKLRLQNTRLKADLYTMVGENYGKILEAADAIKSMKEAANQIKEGLDGSLGELSKVPSQLASPITPANDRLVLAKKVMGGPIDGWRLFEKGQPKEAFLHCENVLKILKHEENLPLEGHLLKIVKDQLRSLQDKIKSGCLESLFDLDQPPPNFESFRDALTLQLDNPMASPSSPMLLAVLTKIWATGLGRWRAMPTIDHAKLLEKNCQLLSLSNQLERVKVIEGPFKDVLAMMTASKNHAMADQILGGWTEKIPALRMEADGLFEEWYQITLEEVRTKTDRPLRIMFEFGKAFAAAYSDDKVRQARSAQLSSNLSSELSTEIPKESSLLLTPLFPDMTTLPKPKQTTSRYKPIPSTL